MCRTVKNNDAIKGIALRKAATAFRNKNKLAGKQEAHRYALEIMTSIREAEEIHSGKKSAPTFEEFLDNF